MPDRREVIPIDALRPAEWNPKVKISGRYKTGLETSLEHFGVRDDLKVWPSPSEPGKYIVLDGNQRLGVLREAGIAEVECRVLEDLDPDDAKLFTASFDRNQAQYSEAKLATLADELRSKGADLVARLLRADTAIVPPPPRDEDTPAVAQAKEDLGSILIMFSLTRDGHAMAKGYLLQSKNKLKREERLLALLACMSERQIDDLIVNLAVQIGAELAK